MREIKFRGKRLDNNKWVIGFLAFIYTEGRDENGLIYTNTCCIYSPEDNRNYDVDATTIGQYTGLKDKNGKKIYEGDVVECIGGNNYPIRHLIKYSDEHGGYVQYLFMSDGIYREPYSGGLICQTYIDDTSKYVIGNIHDNIELLKKH